MERLGDRSSLCSRSFIAKVSCGFSGDTELGPQLPKPRKGVSGGPMNGGGYSRLEFSRNLGDRFCSLATESSDSFVDVKYRDISASVSAAFWRLRLFERSFAGLAGGAVKIPRLDGRLRNAASENARSGTK